MVGTGEVGDAIRGFDRTGVDHVRGNQGHGATIGDDAAVIFYSGMASSIALQLKAACKRILFREFQCRSHQTTDIHLRGFGEDDAIGIQQEHLAIGIEPAHDLAGVVVQDLVDGH